MFCGGIPLSKAITWYKSSPDFLETNHPHTAHASLIVSPSPSGFLRSRRRLDHGAHAVLRHTVFVKAMATEVQLSGETATVVPPGGSNPLVDISTPLIKFPPFPEIPEGVSIIPFSQFRPKGIKKRLVADSDYPDLDGHGRPTVRLKVAHASTSSDKWKKKKRRLGEGDDGVVGKYVWYEEWAKEEDNRKTLVD